MTREGKIGDESVLVRRRQSHGELEIVRRTTLKQKAIVLTSSSHYNQKKSVLELNQLDLYHPDRMST